MAYLYREHQGDSDWLAWLARLMRPRFTDVGRGAARRQHPPAPTCGHSQAEARRPTGADLPQSWRSAGFSEREWQRLGFLRSCYLRGQLTEFPEHQ